MDRPLSNGTVNVNQTLDELETPVARNTVVLPLDYGVFDADSITAAAIDISSNTDLVFNLGWTEITTPAQRGISVQGNANSQISFQSLKVFDAAGPAFATQNNDQTSVVSISGASSLASLSSVLPAFQSSDAAQLLVTLESLSSQTTAPVPAIELQGVSTGQLVIAERFTVEITNPTPPPASVSGPGTTANVSNTTPVSVTLPP
jgi:hypothetical protein